MSTNIRRDALIDILGITIIAALFYFIWLGSYPLFIPDEGRYSEVAREMLATNDYVTPRINGVPFLDKPALYYWLQAFAMNMLGINEWAIRFFPAIFGIFGCIITYLVSRELFNRQTAVLATTILACTPLYFIGTHYANLDLEMAVLVSSSLLCILAAIQKDGAANWSYAFFAYLFAGLAFLTKGMIALFFPITIYGLWILIQWNWMSLKKIHMIIGFALLALIITPWYVLVQKANPTFLHYFFVTQQVTRFLSHGEFNNPSPKWFYLPVIMIGTFPWTIFLFQTLSDTISKVIKARKKYASELYLLLWLSTVIVFFSIPSSKTISYILPAIPPLAILTGRYIDQIWSKPSNKTLTIAVIQLVIGGLTLSALLLLLPKYHWVEFNNQFIPYEFSIAMIFIICTMTSLFSLVKKSTVILFSICLFCSIATLLTVTKGAVYLNSNTTKQLANTLKPILSPRDVVVHYYRFYQDIPIYLNQRVKLVADWQAPNIMQKDNWIRELVYGKATQTTNEWLIDETTFWQDWHSKKRVFVFLGTNYFAQFKSHTPYYYILNQSNNVLLITNKI